MNIQLENLIFLEKIVNFNNQSLVLGLKALIKNRLGDWIDQMNASQKKRN
jgi:hypothetical protein